MNPLDQIQEHILAQFRVFLPVDAHTFPIELTRPPDATMGDLSLACFAFAKVLGKSPAIIAQEFAEQWKPVESISRIVVIGPYLNFFFDQEKFTNAVTKDILSASHAYGDAVATTPARIMIEYAAPNTLKEFHVGHLRNVFLGTSLIRLFRAEGYSVIPVNYINDNGAHIAKCLWAYQKFHRDEPIPENKGKFFGAVYTEATRLLEDSEANKAETTEVQHALDAHDPVWTALWQKTRQWSVDQLDKIFFELGAEFDRVYFSSEVDEPGRHIVADLLAKGIAQKSQGAVIVDLEDEGLGVCVILKTDGGTLYATQDLALPQKKFSEYTVDSSIHVVDNRQSLYFKQLFAIFRRMGMTTPMVHIAYDFVTLADGAMSSRKGNIIAYEDFRDEMLARVCEETKKRHAEWPTKKVQGIAWRVAEGAMKFGMLKQDIDRPIVFDIASALSFDGFTGPYIQYAYARLSSILTKASAGKIIALNDADKNDADGSEPDNSARATFLALRMAADFSAVVKKSADAYSPAILAGYLFNFAQACNDFYRDTPILSTSGEARSARLDATRALQFVLKKGLYLLGISAPDEM